MSRPTVYIDLPEALFALVPELLTLPTDQETLADCRRCARVAAHNGGDPTKPWAFDPEVRCCTYSPMMPNVLVGRALRRGGTSQAIMHKRIAENRDMTAWGLFPGEAFTTAYDDARHRFGRATELTCPFWSKGELGCGIWMDRPPVCRTWHCRYVRGEEGRAQWAYLRRVFDRVLDKLAIAAIAAGRPPVPIDPIPVWEAWFVWCADWVDAEGGNLRGLLRDEHIEEAVRDVVAGAPSTPIPDVVTPAIGEWERDGERLYLIGYNVFDGVHAPLTVFEFLGRLDGKTTWREALAAANEVLAEPLTEAFVLDLYRIGVIRAPQDGDLPTTPSAAVPELESDP